MMRHQVIMERIEDKLNTTRFETSSKNPPMTNFYINTEVLKSLPFDTHEILLHISDEPFDEGEVALAIPSIPFSKVHSRVVRYRHEVDRKGKARVAPNTPDCPVTLVYVNRLALDDRFIEEKLPVHFGISAVNDTYVGG